MAVAPQMSPHAQADAARLLYGRYYPNVYRYALSQLHAAEDAEDAAQNTFLRAFAALQKGTVPENELAWLFKIAHNVCATSKLAWLRRRRVETPRDLTALQIEPSSPETRRDELAGLEHALAAMPRRPREAFLLREVQGLSYAEIAEQLGTSLSAVETLIFRARKMLAEKLEQPIRRARQALGLGPLLNLVRGSFEAAAPTAVKAAGAIAVVAGASVAAAPHPTSSRPAPAAPARVAIAPATVSRPGPHRAARRRNAAPATPAHPPAEPQPRVPPAPGPPQAAAATPTPAEAPDVAAAQPTPKLTAPSTPPIVTLPALPAVPTLPVDVPTLQVTIPPLPAVPLPEIAAAQSVPVPATTPDLPSLPPVTVQVSLP